MPALTCSPCSLIYCLPPYPVFILTPLLHLPPPPRVATLGFLRTELFCQFCCRLQFNGSAWPLSLLLPLCVCSSHLWQRWWLRIPGDFAGSRSPSTLMWGVTVTALNTLVYPPSPPVLFVTLGGRFGGVGRLVETELGGYVWYWGTLWSVWCPGH